MPAPYRPRRVDLPVPPLHQLLAAVQNGDDETWRLSALCAETDPDVFFPAKGMSTAPAKRVCGQCEVRAECLASAVFSVEEFGVWGGLNPRELRDLRSRLRAHQAAVCAA